MAKLGPPTFHVLERSGYVGENPPKKEENEMMRNQNDPGTLLPPGVNVNVAAKDELAALRREWGSGMMIPSCVIERIQTLEAQAGQNTPGAQGGYDDNERLLPPGVV